MSVLGKRIRMPTCNNCQSFVTEAFARVFGNNQNEVNSCMDCGLKNNVRRDADA